jgi:hypothetical protein
VLQLVVATNFVLKCSTKPASNPYPAYSHTSINTCRYKWFWFKFCKYKNYYIVSLCLVVTNKRLRSLDLESINVYDRQQINIPLSVRRICINIKL